MKLIYTGSVKDLYRKNDHLVFEYSDRYSIFDWGEMPDQIPYKGEALAKMASMFFEHLAQQGVPSHFLKASGANRIEVQEVNVLRPLWSQGHYDYSIYRSRPSNCLVPLEVIFRSFLGQGNSLEGRLKKNPAYLEDLGLREMPTAGRKFSPPLIECSTKLESSDRYLTRQEIADMDIVSRKELSSIRSQTEHIVQILEELFSSMGVKLWDGKVEYAFQGEKSRQERGLILVDSIGPDELRLTYEELPLSKEFLRQIYAPRSWARAVTKAKELARKRKTQDWKEICLNELNEQPLPLTNAQLEVASLLYRALANEVALALGKRRIFAKEITLKSWAIRAHEVLSLS